MSETADDEVEVYGCWECGGRGWKVTCPDDMCHGQDVCIHGDPPTPCSNCNADGSDVVEVERQAAEERGRRRGLEEAAKECELRIASWERLRDQPTVAARVDEAESLAEIIRCLAPRDSAPQLPKAGRCNACGGPSAPRDSGKEG